MKFTHRLLFTLLLLLCTQAASAQWLKMIESSDNLYNDAKKEIELKHYQKAITMCEKALDISPKNLDIHLLLGRAFSLAGKIDSARIELNKVLEKNPRYRDAYIYLVNMESAACNYLQALDYADVGLKYFPNDRELLLKKLDIYIKMGDWVESNKLADYLFDRFSSDAYVRSVYLDYKLAVARQYSHRGYIEISKRAYEAVLEQDPMNKEALSAVYTLDMRSGNYESSLAYTNRALQSTPNSFEFLLKKIAILDAMSRYVEAIEVADRMIRLFPSSPEPRRMSTYLRMEAGRYYMNTDPYILFGAVLEAEPGNRDALNYEINIAFSRGMLTEALNWINIGLKKFGNDYDLMKKKMGVLDNMKRYGAASVIAEALYKDSPTALNKATFLDYRTLSAKQYINDLEYDSAVVALKSVLFYDHANLAAINYMISAYNEQKRYDDAIRTIDEGLTYYPENEGLLFRKAALLEGYQRYADAALISKQLLEKHPENRQYMASLIEQSLAAGRQSMQYDDYYNTLRVLKEVLNKQPDNIDALNYIINIESAMRDYDSALYYVDQGLQHYPDSKEFLFRKSLVYAEAKQFKTAYIISGGLYREFPYNMRYKTAYLDQMLGSGRLYASKDEPDSALHEFYKAIAFAPYDTVALYYTINLLNERKYYDTALVFLNRGRKKYPLNPYFLQKKAEILQSAKRYDEAWRNADTLAKLTLNPRHVDYAAMLFALRLKNEIGLFYLHSTTIDASNTRAVSGIATLQFSHIYNKGVYAFRLNYAGRTIGTGFQLEAETYYNHSKRWSSFVNVALSPNKTIFPILKAAYSILHPFPKGYDGELGLRYLQLATGTVVSPTIAVSKEISDFYLSLRAYQLNTNFDKTQKAYYSYIFSARYSLSESRLEYFSAIAGYGTAPDDFSTAYNLGKTISYKSVIVGAGYKRQYNYRTTFAINASWYNQLVTETATGGVYRNQYDIYISLLRKF